jgi:hypothetical protein
MTNVTPKWLKENASLTEKVWEYIETEKSVQTTLTERGIADIECRLGERIWFRALIPGMGWVLAEGY